MKPVAQLNIKEFSSHFDPLTGRVLKMFADHHVPARIVGGAVRDALLGRRPRDIDLLIDDDPSETLFLLELYGIESDVGGIRHGTVKARGGRDQEPVDITSLGFRIQLTNNTPHKSQHQNWVFDSGMRDLSINSMSMNMKGEVWDYQNGLRDLQNHRLRLLSHARTHLQDDPNTIMRYFKAMTIWSNPRLRPQDLALIGRCAHLLSRTPDDERYAKNLLAIQASPNGQNILKLMCGMGLNQYLSLLPC